jgi:putative YhbY family RNA-binding protein
MPSPSLTTAERNAFKAQAHALSPVVIIGDSGLTQNVIAEIDRALTSHQLIKIRVAGDDRRQRLTLLEEICTATSAAPIQQIGKLLIVYRRTLAAPRVRDLLEGRASKTSRTAPGKRNPVSGRVVAARPAKKSDKGPAAHPPRTARVRKSGQKSAKKAFQSQ